MIDINAMTRLALKRRIREAGELHRRIAALEAALCELPALLDQLRACEYTCEAGWLENNVAFRRLEELAESIPPATAP